MSRYVDADELQRKMCGERCGCEYEDCGSVEEGGCVYAQFLSLAPTADVAPIHYGKWIISSDGYYPYCSECHHRPEGKLSNYCPECGADMRGKV